ncbi:C1 family peptidase [uncultured Methanobrevibacter sp.]|uniref:C1 family peptidase n=1 Tax=uncultured Methanobrevibacter sp. TaxID=253161 RepID=UPI0026004B8B|nr:C1 family peptidase [uncultured Methanobrevibacter sp.]
MKFKCMLIASLMLAVLMVGAVSATDTISEDIVSDVDDDHLEITGNDVYTAGESSFSNLTDEIENTGTSLDLNHDYTFNNETDNKNGIVIGKDNFVLNGNGRTIDGKNQSRIFNITANNVTLSNLILTGGNAEKGGAIYATGSLTLNNVTFTNNYAKIEGGAVGFYGNVILTCNNSDFIDNYAEAGSAIFVQKGVLNLYNADLSSKIFNMYSQVAVLANSIVYIENATFSNSNSSYSPALYLRSSKTSIINSKFINLRGNITSGAIGVRMGGDLYVKNCEFINTSSSKNAGAIFADVLYNDYGGVVTIIDTVFKDTSSGFGGAFLQLSGNLFLNNTKFINGHATYSGGSVYLSDVNAIINNCTFDSNGVEVIEGYPTYGGAILLDMGAYNISESKFFNNNASAGAAIYAYDSTYTISNSIFENNTNPIYTFFDKQSIIDETNIFINDNNISTNNTFFATIIAGEGMQLILSNNTINVTTLPTRYDLRDWGWTSSVKAQGWMGSCWTFGMTGVLESSLLKAAGITTDFSENNMQNTMLKYSIYGSPKIYEGGSNNYAVSYLLSWLGAFTQDADTYDEMGKISPLITTNQDIHVQDLMFIHNNEIPNGTHLKEAILKYGSIDVCYYGQSRYDEVSLYYNTETYAQYVDVFVTPNHDVSIVGWDDNFPKEKFLTPPPGDGAWIVKNSWGSGWGENGYLYVSYYDQSLLPYMSGAINTAATAIIFENTVPYNKNYQYDIVWGGAFVPSGNGNISYMNIFEALDDDLIAAVGTYFNSSDVNYKVQIYVNDELRLTQEGVSPFIGYHTIKLDEYIPIKKGDIFKAVMISDAMPGVDLRETRLHYDKNISFFSYDGQTWIDCYTEDAIACLKIYTVVDDTKIINNKDISVDYNGGKYFTVKVVTADGHAVHAVGAGAKVTFTINKKTKTVKTDKNGIAKIKITDVPKKYTIITKYMGKTYKNSVTVKHVLKTSKVTVKKTAKKFTLKATLKINGKLVKGKIIKFKFNGKTYKAKTNKKGIAQKILTKNVINKLKKGKTYTVKVTYLKDTIKTTVKVKK